MGTSKTKYTGKRAMNKKTLIIIAALLLAVAGAAVYVLTNLDSIVKAAIEKYGSEAVKTRVRVSSVRIRLKDGEGTLRGLRVANPSGFSFPSIITLDDISVRIDVRSLAGTPVIIDRVLIFAPEVFYEMKEDGTANADVLKNNLASTPSKEERPKKNSKGKEARLRIRKLVFEKGKIHARAASLAEKAYVLDLPRLEMTDIGGRGGAAPAEVARIVATALAEETAKAVARHQGERLLRKGAERLLNRYLNK